MLSDVDMNPQFATMSDAGGQGDEVTWYQDRSGTADRSAERFTFTLNRPVGELPERLTIADLTAVIHADLGVGAKSLDALDEGTAEGEWMGAAMRVRGVEVRPMSTVIGIALSPLPEGVDVIGVDQVTLKGPDAAMEPEVLYPAPDGSGGTIVGFDARPGTSRDGEYDVRAQGVAIILESPIDLDLSTC